MGFMHLMPLLWFGLFAVAVGKISRSSINLLQEIPAGLDDGVALGNTIGELKNASKYDNDVEMGKKRYGKQSEEISSYEPVRNPVQKILKFIHGSQGLVVQVQVENVNFAAEFVWTPRHGNKMLFWKTYDGRLADGGMLEVEFNKGRYINLFSIPFRGPSDYDVAVLQTKKVYEIERQHSLLANLKFACQTAGVKQHPFPSSLVNDAENDFRLASCIFGLKDTGESGLRFFAAMTNKGVWGIVERRPREDSLQPRFFSFRFLKGRINSARPMDISLEVNNRNSLVRFYVDGVNMWQFGPVGSMPPEDNFTVNARGSAQDSPSPTHGHEYVSLTRLVVELGTATFKDAPDPSEPWDTKEHMLKKRLVRIQPANSKFYAATDSFDKNQRSLGDEKFGQGAVMSLYQLEVFKIDSAPVRHPTTTNL